MSESNESTIDLTDCSFTLADHCRLNNVVINLDTDDSFREEASNASTTTVSSRIGRKRRYTRANTVPETPVYDLCTPENKTRRSSQSKKLSDKASIVKDPAAEIEDPKEQNAKLQLGCCPICFDEFCGQALASTKCGHVYCTKCLEVALKRESRCPTCRTVLKGNLKYHAIFF